MRAWRAQFCAAFPIPLCIPLLTPFPRLPPRYDVLCRTADGDEGGRHQLIAATVNKGDLWILKIQVGDKRWFKGADKEAIGAWNSFTVA